jgi:NADPH2 dehydrogenase
MAEDDINEVTAAFVASARRARRIGFDLVELHVAHGYLLHQFLSPIANIRTDAYSGDIQRRFRFPLAVAAELRAFWPEERALGARITGNDWVEGGLTIADAILFAQRLENLGFDYVCVASGGIAPRVRN